MGWMDSLFQYFGIAGSINQDIPGTTSPDPNNNLRRIRCDANGYLEVVGPGPAGLVPALIYGQNGDTTQNIPFPQYVFRPQQGAGLRAAIGAAAAELGPMTTGKYHQIVVTCLCWIVTYKDSGSEVAVVGTDFPLSPGVYLYLPDGNSDWISFIRDTSVTADGVIAIGQAEL